jgi:hypothetical protein
VFLTSAGAAIALLCTDATHRQQLLRRVCQRLGIRVLSRAYDFTAAAPLQQDDIVDAVTVSKSCLPPSPHAEAAICVEHARSQVMCTTVLTACCTLYAALPLHCHHEVLIIA